MAERRQTQHPALPQGAIEAVVWLTLGIWAFAQTFDFDGPLPTFELGAAFWPRVVIGGVILSAAVLLVGSYVARAKASAPMTEDRLTDYDKVTDELPEDAAHVTKKTLAVFAVPLIYVYAIHKLGFLLITPLFLFGYMYLLGVRRWRTLIAVTAGVYAGIVLIFVKLIFTPLPQGAGYFHSLNGQLIGLLQ
ncbi:MAG: tripartite tricarboxylate transporter TctB family protein [Alphaproteobacteria bacterium]|nr:tripartite tricarboxylate transporter TctB family protein [Alphaproteobacteria bacterium]MCZ6847776.1 tripartite tricarboxylate transporter TctB family protein [Alphaproteobacteria bacterium]